MAGETKKVEYVELKGVKYKAVMTVLDSTNSNEPVKKSHGKILIGAIVAVIIIALGAVILFAKPAPKKVDNGLPVAVTRQAEFHAYYPNPFPASHILDTQSVKISEGVLFYTLKSTVDTSYMTISIQKTPKGLNPEAVLRQPDKEPVQLSIGTLYDKSKDGKNMFVIVTDDNLLIYAYPSSNMERLNAQSIVTSLR